MFFAQLFPTKKAPLAKIWLAAHWDRKLTKAHVFECNLELTVKDIISPQMKIGLRTSSHLLVGVVRIYFRKTKYLLADCSDALVKIRVAFRPDQTDLAVDGLEATVKAITLTEDFTAFNTPLPDLSIDAVDYFSLNQCRSEDITLKEDLGTQFMDLVDFGDESHIGQNALLDMSLQSLRYYDGFGDEDKGCAILDFLELSGDTEESTLLFANPHQTETPESSALTHPPDDSDRMEVEPPETTIQPTNSKTFALEPVLITPNSSRKRGKRKRKLFVDQRKELSNDAMQEQLADCSDLVVPMNLAPPTEQLMTWQESGDALSLFKQPCSTVVAPQITELFSETIFQRSISSVCEDEVEEEETMRCPSVEAGRRDASIWAADGSSEANSLLEFDTTHNFESLTIDQIIDSVVEEAAAEENSLAGAQAELPPEESMPVQQSCRAEDSQPTSLQTQSVSDGDASEDRKMIRRAQKLLESLQGQTSSTFSLAELCSGATRSQAAATFYCLLVLKKRNAIDLQQGAPYQDVIAAPAPAFCDRFTA